MLKLIKSKLVKIETEELQRISKQSQDEAVRLALILAAQPSPPFPDFSIDPKYGNAEELANVIDDVFGNIGKNEGSEQQFSYSLEGGETLNELKNDINIPTDAEASKLCNEWKKNYNVITGVSWGDLPYDLQQKWLQYSCDYHLEDESSASNNQNVVQDLGQGSGLEESSTSLDPLEFLDNGPTAEPVEVP
jgi:hypothetical protein